jgi:hypothetical protein
VVGTDLVMGVLYPAALLFVMARRPGLGALVNEPETDRGAPPARPDRAPREITAIA